jgi:hypothetical protein
MLGSEISASNVSLCTTFWRFFEHKFTFDAARER